MFEVTKKESDELNDWIQSFVDNAENGFNAGDSDKQIFYIGWYWRKVDFTRPFQIGLCKHESTFLPVNGMQIPLESATDMIGFMVNNKWDYLAWDVKPDVYWEIITLLREMRTNFQSNHKISLDKLRAFHEYMQSLRERMLECEYCPERRGTYKSSYSSDDYFDNLCPAHRKYTDSILQQCKELYSHNYTEESLIEHFSPSTTYEVMIIKDMWVNREYRFKTAQETNH